MDPLFQPLLGRLDQLSDQSRELREGVQKAILVADVDPEMALTRSRKVLEAMIRDVFEKRLQQAPGTQPLENLVQRLFQDGHLPFLVKTYATTVRELGNIGTHKFHQTITEDDVHHSLSQLVSVVEWYAQGAPGNPEAVKRQPSRPADEQAREQLAVVPKGLRSFDAADAKFFLDLLPGPRDDKGLPESIRFWKHRIETTRELTFTVGVLYGPSGCGKSSMVKAGLLPRLADRVLSVYVEASAADTEARLLKGLRERCPGLPDGLDLPASLLALRQGKTLNKAQKVLIVLDQFEQWLHARRGAENPQLIQALRQCDGDRVQAVVTVRDDFWLAVSRFMTALNIELLQGENVALVDLFDLVHARSVLAAFGRAFGTLPEDPTREQKVFLDHAVQGLSQDGRVICVRLALFAEMVKGKPWSPSTLKEVGGAEGVGVTFLEETFQDSRRRAHQQAARAVLKALLPEQGSDIKGNMQSHGKLLEASGYARRPKDFEELLRILDSEVRLITPTEPPGLDAQAEQGQDAAAEQYYQLTHDYLVPSLREWLTRKQKETRRGRAEIRLAERAAAWNARLENRHLPAWWEWANIRLFTKKKDWTPSQHKMMRTATRFHAVRGVVLVLLLAALTLTGVRIRSRVIEGNNATRAAGLVHQLLDADIGEVPGIVGEMKEYRHWTDPLLRDAYADAETAWKEARTEDEKARQAAKQLHASVALVPADSGQADYLYGRLLHAQPQELAVIRDALLPQKGRLVERLWAVVEQPPKDDEGQRLRAACALAAYDPDNPRWDKAGEPVVKQLVAVNPILLGFWLHGLRPAKDKLTPPLAAVYRDKSEDRTTERSLATSILADYAADKLDLLVDLFMDGDEKQFGVLYPKLEAHQEGGMTLLQETVKKPLEAEKTDDAKEQLAKRQANAAVALLRLGQADAVWTRLKFRPDPRVRSYLIHRLSLLGADPRALIKQLDQEQEVSIRRALLLTLGEFGAEQLAPADRAPLIPKVLQLYRDDPDAGLHGAAEWLLRQWGQQGKLKEFEQERAKDQQKREERLEQVKRDLIGGQGRGKSYWYVNGQGQTMVVIPGPVEFLMGSPPTETGREGGPDGKVEMQHRKRIGRAFAIAAKEVTVEQFLRFRMDHDYRKQYAPTVDCPVNDLSWYDAAAYCNLLSKNEGIPEDQWCYKPNTNGEYAEGMKLAPDYLKLEGYRLPSEAEWEYACRAGAVTSRSYGETEELLGKYAWYTKNSLDRWMLPGGSLKPNDLGLFDMLANAAEWCQERFIFYQSEVDDLEDKQSIEANVTRVLRGGSFLIPVDVRSAYRSRYQPSYRDIDVGFRPAKTFR